jgi:hypothetical protein
MNQFGNTCTTLANENRELRQQVSLLNARVESLDQFIREWIPSIIQSQETSLKKLSKCMSLFNLPASPLQHSMTAYNTTPPPPMMLSNTNTATIATAVSSAPPSKAAAVDTVVDNAFGDNSDRALATDNNDAVATAKRPFDEAATSRLQNFLETSLTLRKFDFFEPKHLSIF